MADSTFVIGKTTTGAGTEDRYHDEVAALAAAEAALSEDERASGVHATLTITVPAETSTRTRKNKETGETETVPVDTIGRYKRMFQESAKRAGFTARQDGETKPQGDGASALTFTLVPLVRRPRAPKDASTEQTPTEQAPTGPVAVESAAA